MFLGWYWVDETVLRSDCNYTGPIPVCLPSHYPMFPSLNTREYWDWSKYAASPHTSPLFNRDEYSMVVTGKSLLIMLERRVALSLPDSEADVS
jgi:tyrosinase